MTVNLLADNDYSGGNRKFMSFEIRHYHPTDLTAIYRICLGTGDSGRDATHQYADPDLIGHYYAAPYAVLEPQLSFVLTNRGMPGGYALAARDTVAFGERCERDWFPPLRARYPLPADEIRSPDAAMIRAIHRGHDRTNEFPDYPAHLHIDILPQGQGQGWGRKLIDRLLQELRNEQIQAVHLGVGARNSNAIGFYEHVGFYLLRRYETWIAYGMRLGGKAGD